MTSTTGTTTTETLWFTDTRMRILVAEETCTLIEAEARAGNMPPLHLHREEDETFYVIEGRISLFVAGEHRELGPGEAALAPRGVPHGYRVESDAARWLVTTTGGGFAAFIAETSAPAEDDGYAPVEAMPAPEVLGAAAARRGIELLGPPGSLPA